METVLVVGATGHIGIAAIQGALRSGYNVLAIVRNHESAKKFSEHVGEGRERITIVEANVTSDQGIQAVVDKVRAGVLPVFQHVFASGKWTEAYSWTKSSERVSNQGLVGGGYTDQSMLETTTEELHEFMKCNFESNFCKSS